MKIQSFFIALMSVVLFSTCTNNSISPDEATVTLSFKHTNNDLPLELDLIKYTNEVSQEYSITKVNYFVSKITFHCTDGTNIISSDIHFVDIRDSKTLVLDLNTKIPYGSYEGISMIYGLVPEDNITGSLGIDLDRLMEWPEIMGGGYHYMKLEGKYIDNSQTNFFNFHAGGLGGEAYEIHIDLPNSAFEVSDNKISLQLNMEISNWFKNPVNWDFEYWGSGIMGNPDAQATLQKNGQDVFSISIINTDI